MKTLPFWGLFTLLCAGCVPVDDADPSPLEQAEGLSSADSPDDGQANRREGRRGEPEPDHARRADDDGARDDNRRRIPTLTKAQIYLVNGAAGVSVDDEWEFENEDHADGEEGEGRIVAPATPAISTAVCADENDVLLNGGCTFDEMGFPAYPVSIPEYNDDPDRPAQWRCQIRRGTATATAFCLSVN
jgi:hypothetical protein